MQRVRPIMLSRFILLFLLSCLNKPGNGKSRFVFHQQLLSRFELRVGSWSDVELVAKSILRQYVKTGRRFFIWRGEVTTVTTKKQSKSKSNTQTRRHKTTT